jgi:ATP-dependent DNA helicase DinG
MQEKQQTPLPDAKAVRLDIAKAYRALAKATPGFRERKAQQLMMNAIAKTLLDPREDAARIAAIEAPTGVGKSLAYLLAALPIAQALEKKLVIATATVTLQEQLLDELPGFLAATGLDATYILAKGRGRYACALRLAELTGTNTDQIGLDFGADADAVGSWAYQPSAPERHTVAALSDQMRTGAFDGDLDRWPTPISKRLKGAITITRARCLGRACPHVKQCAVIAARRAVFSADIIIANQDLVLADLEMGGGALLPDPEEAIYVFDEAHQLAGKAVDRFAASLPIKTGIKTLTQASKTAGAVLPHLAGQPNARDAAARLAKDAQMLKDVLSELTGWLNGLDWPKPDPRFHQEAPPWRLPLRTIPDPLPSWAIRAETLVHTLIIAAASVKAGLKNTLRQGAGQRAAAQGFGAIGHFEERLERWARVLAAYRAVEPAKSAPIARWIAAEGEGRQTDYTLAASAVSAAERLAETLWSCCHGAVLTSATLSALGGFAPLVSALGLPQAARGIILDSPFQLEQAAELIVPRIVAPSNPERHTEAVAKHLDEYLSRSEASLVLFASARQMRAVADLLDDDLRALVLIQGDLPRAAMLGQHRRRVDAGEASILFGLASFAEGVDLPGALCRHVFIAKIPFAPPVSPIDATKADWLKAHGRNPFVELAVPEAFQKLVQACGRLIRSETDTGTVTILDSRLLTKRYGRQMLAHLPPFRRRAS